MRGSLKIWIKKIAEKKEEWSRKTSFNDLRHFFYLFQNLTVMLVKQNDKFSNGL